MSGLITNRNIQKNRPHHFSLFAFQFPCSVNGQKRASAPDGRLYVAGGYTPSGQLTTADQGISLDRGAFLSSYGRSSLQPFYNSGTPVPRAWWWDEGGDHSAQQPFFSPESAHCGGLRKVMVRRFTTSGWIDGRWWMTSLPDPFSNLECNMPPNSMEGVQMPVIFQASFQEPKKGNRGIHSSPRYLCIVFFCVMHEFIFNRIYQALGNKARLGLL